MNSDTYLKEILVSWIHFSQVSNIMNITLNLMSFNLLFILTLKYFLLIHFDLLFLFIFPCISNNSSLPWRPVYLRLYTAFYFQLMNFSFDQVRNFSIHSPEHLLYCAYLTIFLFHSWKYRKTPEGSVKRPRQHQLNRNGERARVSDIFILTLYNVASTYLPTTNLKLWFLEPGCHLPNLVIYRMFQNFNLSW